MNKKSGDGKNRKRSHGENAGGGGEKKDASSIAAFMVGSLMDNIPENLALGIFSGRGEEEEELSI